MTKQSQKDRHDIQHLEMFWIPQAKLEVVRTAAAAKRARGELRAQKDRRKKLKARVKLAEHG